MRLEYLNHSEQTVHRCRGGRSKKFDCRKTDHEFKDVAEEQSMFLRRGFLVLCRAT